MEPLFLAGFGIETMDGIVSRGAKVNQAIDCGGEVAGVEIPHRLQAIIFRIGIPLGGAGPSLLGCAAVVGPSLLERKSEGLRGDAAAAIVMPVSGPRGGGGDGAESEEKGNRVHYFLASSVIGARGMPELAFGINAREVSIQPPQEHPPPPSGTRKSPWDGRKLSQQEGRRRGQCVGFFSSCDQKVRQRLMPRKRSP